MNLKTEAKKLGYTIYSAGLRPAQSGDILHVQKIAYRREIDLDTWSIKPQRLKSILSFFRRSAVLESPLVVAGDHDVVLLDSHGLQIRTAWGKAFVETSKGVEFITYSTDGALVLSKYETIDNERRVLACFAGALHAVADYPTQEKREKYFQQAYELLASMDSSIQVRWYDAPLLYGWPAPEFGNDLAKAIVICARDGGKASGDHHDIIPDSLEVPDWRSE